MGRAPCCDKTKVKRGPWSPEEDALLKDYLHNHGTTGNWIALPHKAGLNRCGKSCRLRWMNYLRPDIKHGGFTEEEDSIIYTLYLAIGSRWSVIASKLPGRTDNDVKNYWNTKLKKKIMAGKVRGFEGTSAYNVAAYNTDLSGLVQPNSTRIVQVKQEQETYSTYDIQGDNYYVNDDASLMSCFPAERAWDPIQDSNWTCYHEEISRVSELSSTSMCSSDDQNSHGCSASWGSAHINNNNNNHQVGDDFWLRLLVDQSTFMAGSNSQLIAPVFDGPVFPNHF